MFEGRTDYWKINRRLRRQRWQKRFGYLWTLLIIPLGFVLYFAARSARNEAASRPQLTLAGPVRLVASKSASSSGLHAPRASKPMASSRAGNTQVARSTKAAPKKSAPRSVRSAHHR